MWVCEHFIFLSLPSLKSVRSRKRGNKQDTLRCDWHSHVVLGIRELVITSPSHSSRSRPAHLVSESLTEVCMFMLGRCRWDVDEMQWGWAAERETRTDTETIITVCHDLGITTCDALPLGDDQEEENEEDEYLDVLRTKSRLLLFYVRH